MPGQPKDKLEIPLGLGVKTDIDDKLLPVGKVFKLENCIWEVGGEVIKRNGSLALGTQYAAGTPGTMPQAWQLATHKGALVSLSVAGPRPIGVYSPALQKWIAPSGANNADLRNGAASKLRGQVLPQRTPVYRSNAAGATTTVYATDQATDGTYTLVCWTDSVLSANATLRGQLVENSTGKTLFTFARSQSTGNGVARACFVNSEFRLAFIDGVNVKYVTWTLANINNGSFSPSAEFSLATDATVYWLDVIAAPNGTDMLVLYDGATTRIVKRDSGGVNTASNLTAQGGGAVAIGHHTWMRDLLASGKIAAVVSSATDGVRVHFDINTATGTTANSYTIDGAAGLQDQVEGHTISSSAVGEFVVLYRIGSGTGTIKWARRQSGATTLADWIIRAALASQAWLQGTAFYINIAYESDEQGTYFAIRVPTNVAAPGDNVDGNTTPSARFCTGRAPNQAAAVLPSVVTAGANAFRTALAVKTRLDQQAGFASVFDAGVDLVLFTYDPSNVNRPVEFADNLYVCGGILGAFDGRTFAEEGFHLFPEGLSFVQQVGGSLTLLGNYQYCAVYRYTDDFGRLRRSAPSDPIQVTLTGSNQGVQVTVRTLKLHGRPPSGSFPGPSGVVIELYRTANNVTDEFHLVGVAKNLESADTVTFTDTQSDTSGLTGEELYTDGGVLESEPPPAPLAIATYKDRVAVIDADDRTLIWISLPLSETGGPRFSSSSTIRIDDSRGELTTLAAVDDRLIAFKKDAIYTITGDGPDTAGNGTFGIGQLTAPGVGCSVPRSIVEVPDGVMFRSSSTREGIHIINRGMAVEYIGGDVQAFLAEGIPTSDAIHLPGLLRTEYWFSGGSGSGRVLVYDHTLKMWTTRTGQYSLAVTAWNPPGSSVESYAYQGVAGTLSVLIDGQDDSTFAENGSLFEQYIETPWLALAKLKGFERFRKVQIVGEGRIINDSSDPGYRVVLTIWKDYNDTPLIQQARTLTVTDDINLVELKYSAKVSAIKIGVRIQRDPGGAGSNDFAGPRLTALSLEYSLKEGMRRTAYTNRTT